jgi:hypothetical protein
MFRLNQNKREDQPKQFDREHILLFSQKMWGFSGFLSFFSVFGLIRKSFFRLFHFYTEIESFDFSIEPKQTEDLVSKKFFSVVSLLY